MRHIIFIIMAAVFVNNYVLQQFLGIRPLPGVSKKQDQARGMARQAPAARDSFPLTCSPMKMSVTKPVCGG